MTLFSRKDSLITAPKTPLKTAAFALLALIAASAQAQSSSSSYASIDYSFALNPNSVANSQYLTVSDSGEDTYNLITGTSSPNFYQPYTSTSGSGSAYAAVNPNTNYDGTTWSGYNAINSYANESSPTGTASASVGSQENLSLHNSGKSDITIDITAYARALGSASITGASSGSNYATVDTYVGIYNFDFATLSGVDNPLIHVSGSDSGITTSYTSDWTPIVIGGDTYYKGTYSMTIAAGDTNALQFYTSSKNVTAAAVPTPPSVLTLLMGLGGLCLRKRKPSK